MHMNSNFHLDYNKVKVEDRRWLLNFWTNHTKWQANNILNLVSIHLVLLSLLIASYAMLISLEGGFTFLVKILGIVFLVFVIIAYLLFQKYKRFFYLRGKNADKHYKKIFEIHFDYARKKTKK